MFHQKMIYQILDGIINEMTSLNYDYNQRASKLGYYALIQKNCCDSCYINSQCFCFHSLSSIIYGNKNTFVPFICSYWLNWPHKIKSPFHKWFLQKTCDKLCKTLSCQSSCFLTCITKFIVIMHVPVHSWPLISSI